MTRRGQGKRRLPPERNGSGGRPLPLASVAVVAVAIALVAVVAVVALSGGDDDGAAPGQPAAEDAPPDDPAAVQDAAPDGEAIEALARDSIEVLPAGQWPSLYDSFTAAFRQRCPRDEFEQAGLEAAADLGPDVQLLRYVRLEGLSIQGDTATATIVGEVQGQGEYRIQASFQREDGEWRMAAGRDTAGCQAFGRVEG